MKKSVLALSVLAGLAAAAPASAGDYGQARAAAVKACNAERKADPAAFQATYGPKQAMRNCKQATTGEAKNAAKACKAERQLDPEAFAAYGSNHNARNALGKCVSSKLADDGEPGEEIPEGA
jgi:hypothetical protein